jgi:predicted phosphodiesterase
VRKLAWAGAVLGGLALLFAGWCLQVDLRHRSSEPLRIAGSTPSGAYRVAVLGDSQKGLSNLRNLVAACQEAGAVALFHTGDLVASNDDGHYRLAAEYLRRGGLRVPLYAIPGNHDVKGGPERFVRDYGPVERVCSWGRVAFLLLDDADGRPPEAARLDALLASIPAAESVVLLLHVPPLDEKGQPYPEFRPFLAWIESTPRVKYVFSGHLHRYFTKTIGEAKLVVNGVGGDYESWQLSQKVYATLLDVDGAALKDSVLELPPEHGLLDNLEHFAVGHFGEALRNRPLPAALGLGLLAVVTGLSIGVLRSRGR